MTAPTQLATGPLTFGNHVGHRDRDAWLDHAPGRVVAVDTTCDPPRVRVHPTRDRHPEWEADATDLVRLGRSCACGYGYLLGDDVSSDEPSTPSPPTARRTAWSSHRRWSSSRVEGTGDGGTAACLFVGPFAASPSHSSLKTEHRCVPERPLVLGRVVAAPWVASPDEGVRP